MFMKYDEVCDVIGTASLGKVLHYVVASVDPVRVGENQTHLLHSRSVNQRPHEPVNSSLPWQIVTILSSGPSTSSR
jgi:hypothetical protein